MYVSNEYLLEGGVKEGRKEGKKKGWTNELHLAELEVKKKHLGKETSWLA